jgi:hypothetical protein
MCRLHISQHHIPEVCSPLMAGLEATLPNTTIMAVLIYIRTAMMFVAPVLEDQPGAPPSSSIPQMPSRMASLNINKAALCQGTVWVFRVLY